MITVKIPRRVAAWPIPDLEGGWTVWDGYHSQIMPTAPQGMRYEEAKMLAHDLSRLLIAMYYS